MSHHPGPPRFVAVGEAIELAPRDPDPEGSYRWRIRSAPFVSTVELGDDPVEEFAPDVAGTYTLELAAPDGTHRLTVRAFPSGLAPADGDATSGVSGGAGPSGPAGASGPNVTESADEGLGSGVRGTSEGQDGEGTRPRVQLRGAIEGDEVVVRADPRPNPHDDTPREELTVEFVVDDRSDVDEAAIDVQGRELRVPAAAIGEWTRVHAVAVGPSYSVPDAIDIYRNDGNVRIADLSADDGAEVPSADATTRDAAKEGGAKGGAATGDAASNLRVARPYDPPEWATEVTLYEIYVRAFTDGADADSTFDALVERLDYLEDLGVDCLWLTPVLQNDHAPHGYNITDFFSIARDLGDREDYEAFVDAAHDRGMRVLFDLVLNHSARDHPFFREAYRNPDSEYYDWYEWQEDGEPGTYFEWEYIANFDHANLAVRRHLLDAVDEWFEVADGFRCDMAWAVPRSLWQEVRDRVKSRDPEFLLLDETIPYVADFHEGMFDVHFDTTLYFTLRQVGRGDAPADAILDAVEARTAVGFPDHAAFMVYQENHDETRYVVECGDDAAQASAGALFTLPGVPMLYAGQEIGQRGRRDALAWEHARETVATQYERLIDLRDSTPALGHGGEFHRVAYEADSDRATAFVRERDGEAYVVVLNFGADPTAVAVEPTVDPADLLTGDSIDRDGKLIVDDVAVLRAVQFSPARGRHPTR